MHKFLLSLGLSAMLGMGAAANNITAPYLTTDNPTPYEKMLKRHSDLSQRQWLKGEKAPSSLNRAQSLSPTGKLSPTSSWGTLYTPDDQTWLYTLDYTYSDTQSIEEVGITIYDANLNVYSTVTMDLELGEGETSINFIELVPSLTRKFFNYDDSYEIMVFVHATTEDFAGHYYTKVFSLKDGSFLGQIEGNNIGMINTAQDSWSENYTVAFMREEITEDFSYHIAFDIYTKVTWGNQEPNLEHTFVVDNETFAGAGDMALPMLMNARGRDIFYALPHYEYPFYDSETYWDETPLVTPDNHFIIDLYNSNYEKINTTSIPMETKEGYLYSFPGMGELFGFNDLSFGMFSDGNDPAYIVGYENYTPAMDDFVIDLVAYDIDGNKIATIVEDATDILSFSPVKGQEEQICVFNAADLTFDMINIPSCEVVTSLSILTPDGNNLTTTIDRTPVGSSYQYVVSYAMGEVDQNDNTLHKIAWYNSDGTLNHIDAINLGKDITLALPYIAQEAFDPYIFNTDSKIEYMFLVKQLVGDGTSRSQEKLRIYGSDSKLLLELGPDEDGILSSVFLLNPTLPSSKLMVMYYGEQGYIARHYTLPFIKFAGGDGTAENPYIISSPGDLSKMYLEPSANYVLGNDIDFAGLKFKTNSGYFSGTLDGQEFLLVNMDITDGGLFEYITDKAVIKNVNFRNCNLTGSNGGGFIAIETSGMSTTTAPMIFNIYADNCKITASHGNWGGIVGTASLFSNIQNCIVKDCEFAVDGNSRIGGIVGELMTSSNIKNCYVTGAIEGDIAGGIVGYTFKGDESIVNCHVDADVTGHTYAGGIIGDSSRSTVSNCYVQGTVSATGSTSAYAGGIAGRLEKTYDETPNFVITNNIVAAESITANPDAKQAAAHRIVGNSSIDQREIDWDHVTPGMNKEDFPTLPSTPEIFISNNYAIGLTVCDTEIADDNTSTEGETITFANLTETFLIEHNWALGETVDAPWLMGEECMNLYIEGKDPQLGIGKFTIDTASKSLLSFNGSELKADGQAIEVFNMQGIMVARANGEFYVRDLARGAYIARAGKDSIKFIIK